MARPRKAPAAAPPSDVVAECLWPNVWTSRGKMLRGQTLSIPADEFKALFAKRAVFEAPEVEDE